MWCIFYDSVCSVEATIATNEIFFFANMASFIVSITEIDRYDGVLLLNDHGDLHFYCIVLVYKLSPLNKK